MQTGLAGVAVPFARLGTPVHFAASYERHLNALLMLMGKLVFFPSLVLLVSASHFPKESGLL